MENKNSPWINLGDDMVKAYKEAIGVDKITEDINKDFDKQFPIQHMKIDQGKAFDNVTVEHFQIPAITDLAIDEGINNILGREDLIMQMNRLVLKDEQERYVRELLNRLHKITTYMEEFIHDMETGGINVDLVIDIAKGNDISKYEMYFKYGNKHQQELFEMLRSKGDK